MFKNKVEKKGPNDYKEPYEFRLLIGDSIICQRYFRINNFNPNSLKSVELTNTIRRCANMINEDLKSKTRVYAWHMAPLIFDNEKQMREWFSKPSNTKNVRFYENVLLRNEEGTEYAWNGEELIKYDKKIFDGTFTNPLTDRDVLTYEFAFYVNGVKIVSASFDGVYPYYIRRNIDLSNNRGRFEGDDLTKLSFESYILNRLVYDRQDMIKRVVKEICDICGVTDNSHYTHVETFVQPNGEKVNYELNYDSQQVYNIKYAKEIAKMKKYLFGDVKPKQKKG